MSTLFVSKFFKYALAAMGGFYTMKVRSKDDIELVPDWNTGLNVHFTIDDQEDQVLETNLALCNENGIRFTGEESPVSEVLKELQALNFPLELKVVNGVVIEIHQANPAPVQKAPDAKPKHRASPDFKVSRD